MCDKMNIFNFLILVISHANDVIEVIIPFNIKLGIWIFCWSDLTYNPIQSKIPDFSWVILFHPEDVPPVVILFHKLWMEYKSHFWLVKWLVLYLHCCLILNGVKQRRYVLSASDNSAMIQFKTRLSRIVVC